MEPQLGEVSANPSTDGYVSQGELAPLFVHRVRHPGGTPGRDYEEACTPGGAGILGGGW